MLVVCGRGRLDPRHFLQEFSNIFHVPPWHQHRVSHLFPPHHGLTHAPNAYICGFNHGRERCPCAQGLRGMTVNVQKRSRARIWPLGLGFIMVAKPGFPLPFICFQL